MMRDALSRYTGGRIQMKFGITVAAVSLALLGAELPVATGAATPNATTAASTTDTVKAMEFKYVLSKSTVSRGTVTFKIKNAGHLKHDFKINGKKSKLLNPGASTTLTVSFSKAGKFSYLCTVPGHAQAGMKGKLTVK
jgi:nitrite reductase (NO-forming)